MSETFKQADACTMIIFGATGDLAHRIGESRPLEIDIVGGNAAAGGADPGIDDGDEDRPRREISVRGRQLQRQGRQVQGLVTAGRDPLGRVFTVRSTWPGNKDAKVEWFELVGVVDEISPILHDLGTRSLVYFPLGQEWRPST